MNFKVRNFSFNSIEEVNITDDINITLKDGSLECNVNKINSKEV